MTAPVVEQIQEIIARIARIAPPAPDADVFEAGLASVDALELLIELEDVFQISIPDDRFITIRTVAGLTALVDDLRNEGAA